MLMNAVMTWLNGALRTLDAVTDPVVLAAVVVLGGFALMARTEVAELDRQGGKPVVGNH